MIGNTSHNDPRVVNVVHGGSCRKIPPLPRFPKSPPVVGRCEEHPELLALPLGLYTVNDYFPLSAGGDDAAGFSRREQPRGMCAGAAETRR